MLCDFFAHACSSGIITISFFKNIFFFFAKKHPYLDFDKQDERKEIY